MPGGREDGYFAADWAQPRQRRRAAGRASAKVSGRRLSRGSHRAGALAAAATRPESRGRRQGLRVGMARIFSGMKLIKALPAGLVLNEKMAEKILETTGFLTSAAPVLGA